MRPSRLADLAGDRLNAAALDRLLIADIEPDIRVIQALCDVSGALKTKADEVLQRLMPRWTASDIDTSVVITGIDQVPRPQDYQQTLRTLARHCSDGTLATCEFLAVRSALVDDTRVVDALLALAGISYRQLADQLQRAGTHVPSNVEGPWASYEPGLREVFKIVDDVVRGQGRYASATAPIGFKPARPIEMLWGEISGWTGVQHALEHGVSLGALLAQRAVGSAYRQHRDSTSSQVSSHVADRIDEVLQAAKLPFARVGSQELPPRRVKELLGFQGASFVLPGESPKYAIAVRVANDPGTAKSAAAQLAQIDPGKVVLACVVVGPGWSSRVRETVKAARQLGGRIFSERQLAALVSDIRATLRHGETDG